MNQNINTDPRLSDAPAPFRSSWQQPLPADEIARQQDIKALLRPGMRVQIRDLGFFTYSGLWDTMHAFYPDGDQDLPGLIGESPRRRYLKRDLRGRHYLLLPYTVLADHILPADNP